MIGRALVSRARATPRWAALVAGLAFSLALLVCAEVAALAINQLRTQDVVERGGFWSPTFVDDDPGVGRRPVAGAKERVRYARGDTVVYDVTYSTDDVRRRLTRPPAGPADRSLVFFGGSFTFGQGVEDDESLPARAQLHLAGARAYNYGVPTWGPQHMLALLEDGRLRSEVATGATDVVYVFIDDHLRRLFGTSRIVGRWGRDFPSYGLNDEGELERRGTFSTDGVFVHRVYRWLGGRQLARLSGVDLPRALPAHADTLFVAAVRRAAKLTRAAFGDEAEFHVLFFPGSEHAARLVGKLRDDGVNLLDYSALWAPGAHTLPDDGHPNAEGYDLVARRLAADLGGTGAP